MYLNCHSWFSLRYGTLAPKELVRIAAAKGIQTLALTDINNTSCTYEFITECRQAGIKPVVGIEFRNGSELLFIGLAQNSEGFRQLNALLSKHSFSGKDLPVVARELDDVFIIYPRLIKDMAAFRENEFLGIRPEHVARLFGKSVLDHPEKLVAWSPVTFLDKEGFEVHQLLRAIDQNVILTKLKKGTCAQSTEVFHRPEDLKELYKLYPFLLQQAQDLLQSCHIDLEADDKNNRQTFTGSPESDYHLLEKLALEGIEQRYGKRHKMAFKRAEEELKAIKKLGFCPYFLISWDIIRYASQMNFQYVGRGSGANSIVAYALRITDVDPLQLGLPFERFINETRTSPPDFDIDFSWNERDQILDYIFKRYGSEYTAMFATYSTFKGRSIIRELGKVYGLPKFEIDNIVADPNNTKTHHELAQKIFRIAPKIAGMPNYLSMHAGGVVISEKPINYYTALQMMPKGFPITHFDMYHGEALKFHKYDILSQRGLGHINDTIRLVKENQGKAIDIHDTENIMEDRQVKRQLRSAQCIGCFYIESPAMRGLLSKLSCDNYLELVAASSIIRPGVAQSGMMQEYIKRKHHPHSFAYLHPVFEEELGETYGVMVYQEDVMKIAHRFADLPMDECDVLRRIMSGKKAQGDTFQRLQAKYFAGCKKLGHSEALAREVWRQISSFAGYSFCKAHSASYAVESFQSLFLKTYYPLEFMVGVINNFGGFYHTEYYFHEARMAGAILHAPCINNSKVLTTIEGQDIYVGFIHIQGLERDLALRIVESRIKEGPFSCLNDFVARVDISTTQLDILIRMNTFRFTGMNKYELIWQKNGVLNSKTKFEHSGQLFPPDNKTFSLPELTEGDFDQAFDEIELLGFPLRSPFDLLLDQAFLKKTVRAQQLREFIGKYVQIIGYYVCRKSTYTKQAKLMNFGTWLDIDGYFFDTTHFPQTVKRYPLKGKGIYLIRGKVVSEFGFPSIELVKLELLPMINDRRYGKK